MNWKCKIFGHNHTPVYIGGKDFKIICSYCNRCRRGYRELLDFAMKYGSKFNTYEKKYFEETK